MGAYRTSKHLFLCFMCERILKLNTWFIHIKMKEGKKKKKKKKDDEDDEDLGKAVG